MTVSAGRRAAEEVSRARAEDFAARAGRLGYLVATAAAAYVNPDTGAHVPEIYRISGFGLATMFRGDDLAAWGSVVSTQSHERRARLVAGTVRPVEVRPLASAVVSGPVPAAAPGDPGRDYPQMSSYVDLEPAGYVEEEFFVSGSATSYVMPELGDAIASSTGHPYRSRALVRRPLDVRDFNGTVIVDWANVTAFSNVDHLWLEAAPSLMREGYAYVAVSTQRAGIHAPTSGLRAWSPGRYGSLDVTDGGAVSDDSLCYDIFAQIGLALRKPGPVALLGPLEPKLFLAYGASQSNRQLAAFHNGLHASAPVYDGYLLATGRAVGALRAGVAAKVFRVNSETDVVAAGYVRLPDSDRLRTWEVPGTSHTTWQLVQARSVPERRGDIAPLPLSVCEQPPLARVPLNHATVAAMQQLESWVREEREPTRADPIELVESSAAAAEARRDEHGNATGGLRLSQHAVATACNTGLNSGAGPAPLCGSHVPFPDELLASLYPTRHTYVAAVRAVDDENVRRGFILPAHAEDNLHAAERAAIGAVPA